MWVFPLRFASSRKPPRRLLNSEPVKNMRRTREQQILAGRAKAVLEPEFCTSTDTGRILVTVLGMVAEMEREFILERQRTGIEADKKGHLQGPQAVRASGDGAPAARRGKGPAEIATALDVSRMSVWRAAIAAISADAGRIGSNARTSCHGESHDEAGVSRTPNLSFDCSMPSVSSG
jgi:Resolvase, N terminal domain